MIRYMVKLPLKLFVKIQIFIVNLHPATSSLVILWVGSYLVNMCKIVIIIMGM